MVPGSVAPTASMVPPSSVAAISGLPDVSMPDISMIGSTFPEDPEEVARKLEEQRSEMVRQYTEDLEKRMSAGLLGIELELAFNFLFCCFVFNFKKMVNFLLTNCFNFN